MDGYKDTFDQKLTVGLAGEYLAAHYFQNVLNKEVTLNSGFSRSHDLLVTGKPVEIKTDIIAAKSGNICLEHRSLETHTAPTIVFLVPTFYWVSRKDAIWMTTAWPSQTGGDDQRPITNIPYKSPEFNELFHKLH